MSNSEKHTPGYSLYGKVLITLMILTVITITAPSLHLSGLTILIALLIASTKAGIVMTYFMHLRFEHRLLKTLVIIVLGLYTSVIILTFSDYFYRFY
jgi:cytochrome c oxidase subunit IV